MSAWPPLPNSEITWKSEIWVRVYAGTLILFLKSYRILLEWEPSVEVSIVSSLTKLTFLVFLTGEWLYSSTEQTSPILFFLFIKYTKN